MNLRQILHHRFPDLPIDRLVGGFDRVGDIAVIILPPELAPQEGEIGRAILQAHCHLRVVARRAGAHGGEYRTLPLAIIAGEQRLHTVHRENGITLHLDLEQVYFSVRLAHERARIAALVAEGEQVAVLCSGIGPYPLIIARHSRAQLVAAVEKNPLAHDFARKNVACNRKLRPIRLYQGDAAQVLPGLGQQFDRILVILPHHGEALLACALDALRPGGRLHFYDMQAKGCHHATLDKVEQACRTSARRLLDPRITVCGRCGPAVHRLCLDAVIF